MNVNKYTPVCFCLVSIAIGWNCILTMSIQTVVLKLPGTTQALHVMAVANNVRYEFIFTNLGTSTQNFSPIFDILRSYQETAFYREMRLRSAVLSKGRLNHLKGEEVINEIAGVWNLSSDQGNLGTLLSTNVRLLWYAEINESFNMSLPWVQMQSIELRNSKYGLALVITCKERGGGYILGFRIDPQDRLAEIYKELTSLHTVYTESPMLGVTYEKKRRTPQQHLPETDIEELDENQLNEFNQHFHSSAYIIVDKAEEKEKPIPVYAAELGFAVEKPRDGLKLKDLFQVII